MGLSDWQDMARQVVEDPVLQGLSDDQVRAIIDVFALIIQADRQVNPAEVVGFNYLFYDLDWMSQRHEVIKGRIGSRFRDRPCDQASGDGKSRHRYAQETPGCMSGGAAHCAASSFSVMV